jgi:hypothetical protein
MIKRTLLFLGTTATLLAATAPFQEDFEAATGAPGTDLAAASADWTSDSAGTAVISNNGTVITELGGYGGTYPLPAAAHVQVLEVGSNTQLAVSHANNETTTTDLMVRAVRATTPPAGNAADQCALYIDDATGKVTIYHDDTLGGGGPTWTTLGSSPVIADKTWIRLTVTKDYRNKRFKVAVDGTEITHATLGYAAASGGAANGPYFDFVNQNGSLAQVEVEGSSADPTYIEDVVLTSTLAITADENGLGHAGDTSNDDFVFTYGATGTLALTINGTAFVNNPITSPTITIEGTASDNDTVIFNGNGGPLPTITFNGGAGGNDTLQLLNAPGTTLTYTPTSANDGTIDIDGVVTTFTGLEPIVQSGSMANVIITDATTGNQTLTITAVGTTQTNVAASAFEDITFTNPTSMFTLNAGVGNDDITIGQAALNGLAGATITINGDGEATADSLTVDAENGWATHTPGAPESGQFAGHAWTLDYNEIETVNAIANLNLSAVPALGTWGIVILALLIAIGGLRNLPNAETIVVSREVARETAGLACGIVIGAYVLALAFGSAVTMWDLPGTVITFGLLNYVAAWFKQFAVQAQGRMCRQTI